MPRPPRSRPLFTTQCDKKMACKANRKQTHTNSKDTHTQVRSSRLEIRNSKPPKFELGTWSFGGPSRLFVRFGLQLAKLLLLLLLLLTCGYNLGGCKSTNWSQREQEQQAGICFYCLRRPTEPSDVGHQTQGRRAYLWPAGFALTFTSRIGRLLVCGRDRPPAGNKSPDASTK